MNGLSSVIKRFVYLAYTSDHVFYMRSNGSSSSFQFSVCKPSPNCLALFLSLAVDRIHNLKGDMFKLPNELPSRTLNNNLPGLLCECDLGQKSDFVMGIKWKVPFSGIKKSSLYITNFILVYLLKNLKRIIFLLRKDNK